MNKFQWNRNKNTAIFIQETDLERTVCKIAAIWGAQGGVSK